VVSKNLVVAAYVKDLGAGKLDARAQKGRFVGYDSESKGFRIYGPESRKLVLSGMWSSIQMIYSRRGFW